MDGIRDRVGYELDPSTLLFRLPISDLFFLRLEDVAIMSLLESWVEMRRFSHAKVFFSFR
jgi:hypothetical protein